MFAWSWNDNRRGRYKNDCSWLSWERQPSNRSALFGNQKDACPNSVWHQFFFFFFFWPRRLAHGILIPWPGIEPGCSAVKAWSPNHWTAREVPWRLILKLSLHHYPYVLVLISSIFLWCQGKLHSVLQKSVIRSHQTEYKIKVSNIYRATDYEPSPARLYSKCFACDIGVNPPYDPRKDTLIMLTHFTDGQTETGGGEAQNLRVWMSEPHRQPLRHPVTLPFTWGTCLEKRNWEEKVFIFNFQTLQIVYVQYSILNLWKLIKIIIFSGLSQWVISHPMSPKDFSFGEKKIVPEFTLVVYPS